MLALLGDNGAGKSTLIKCISGVHRLDAGTIEIDGAPVDISSPAAARAPASRPSTRTWRCSTTSTRPPTSTPAGRWPGRLAAAGPAVAAPRRHGRGHRRGAQPPAGRPARRAAGVGLLSGGQRQAIAVARAAAFASQVVILDEPTAALGLRESRRVLDLILRLRDEGRAVIVISHAMDHVMEIADRAIVMRRGRKVGEEVPRPENQQRIVSLIVGGDG